MRTLSASDRERVAGIPLLVGRPPSHREELIDASTAGSWDPGELVIREGTESRDVYVVLEGRAQVTVHAGGNEVVLADLGPGDVFGEEGLLAGTPRAATVTAATHLRCAVVPGAAFQAFVSETSTIQRRLERLTTRRLRERLVRSVSALHDLELAGIEGEDVTRVSFDAGARMLAQGEPSDAVFFVLDGVAVALKDGPDSPATLTRVGPGQYVGEVGVLRRAPRAASVFAETRVDALRVGADRFRAWVSGNPSLADHLGSLERIYPLADGRRLSVFRSLFEGRESVTTLAGDPAGDCVLSTKVLGEDIVLLARGSTGIEGEQEVVRFARPQGGMERELLLDSVERGPRGELLRARVCGVEVRGVGLDVPRLYHAVRDRAVVGRKELQRFRHSGYLGSHVAPRDPNNVCACLGIGRAEVAAAMDEHGPETAAVFAALGVGIVCGACLPFAEQVAAGTAPPPESSKRGAEEGARSGSPLVSRRPEIEFDADALLQLSAEPELHTVAVASLFATVGERFMVRHVEAVLPEVGDPVLRADAEVFLEQERLHIAAHEPLNRLLLEHVFAGNRALQRCSRGMAFVDRLRPKTALAMCAAFEHVADCVFASFFEEYYRQGRRYSPAASVHELVVRSGAGPLLHWHGGEELSHRHVAFDVMRARGAGYLARVVGLGLLGLQAALLLIPAMVSMRASTRGRARLSGHKSRGGGARIVFGTAWKGLRFLRPGFHPRDERYAFEADLDAEMRAYPEA